MNPVDRAIYRALLLIPRRTHRSFPLWLKRALNRWMRHRGDPGDNV